MKYIFLSFILSTFIYATNIDTSTTLNIDSNTTQTLDKYQLVEVKDNSGLSDDEVRDIANSKDSKVEDKVSLKKVYEITDSKGKVDLSKIQKKWEELSPSPEKNDWIQTKSGEWFKGQIKALYNGELEFKSKEIGLHSFNFSNITQIKSYNIISANIENLASVSGVLRLNGDKLKLIQGDTEYNFKRRELVSFAPDGELESNFWSGKMILSIDVRNGNTSQFDYGAQVNLQRRTASSRLSLDYLGRVTSIDNTETAHDHRLNQKYDYYLSRHFFLTPLFSEYYTDKYKNIDHQFTTGIGVGYTLIDTTKREWSFSGGPAFLYTKYYTVANNRDRENLSPALELSTHYNLKLNSITDVKYDYKLTYTDESAGVYKHHMVLTFENQLTSWLDIDLSGIWDYILEPEETSDGSYSLKSDFQLLVGLGVRF